MDPYPERMAALDVLGARMQQFWARPFPTEWAKVVNGVGLASFTMSVERRTGDLWSLSQWKPAYLHSLGAAQPFVADLRALLETFEQFMPALPPEPRSYFEELRALVAAIIAFAEEWWAVDEAGDPLRHARPAARPTS